MAVNVRINNGNNIGQVKLTQKTRSIIVDQNFKPKPNVAMTDLTDTDVVGVQNGQVIQYNSTLGKFVANTVIASVIAVNGGYF
jgi:hypothetical protein